MEPKAPASSAKDLRSIRRFLLSASYLIGGESRVRPATRRLGVTQQAADLHGAAAAAGAAGVLTQRRTLEVGAGQWNR